MTNRQRGHPRNGLSCQSCMGAMGRKGQFWAVCALWRWVSSPFTRSPSSSGDMKHRRRLDGMAYYQVLCMRPDLDLTVPSVLYTSSYPQRLSGGWWVSASGYPLRGRQLQLTFGVTAQRAQSSDCLFSLTPLVWKRVIDSQAEKLKELDKEIRPFRQNWEEADSMKSSVESLQNRVTELESVDKSAGQAARNTGECSRHRQCMMGVL